MTSSRRGGSSSTQVRFRSVSDQLVRCETLVLRGQTDLCIREGDATCAEVAPHACCTHASIAGSRSTSNPMDHGTVTWCVVRQASQVGG